MHVICKALTSANLVTDTNCRPATRMLTGAKKSARKGCIGTIRRAHLGTLIRVDATHSS